MAYEELTPERIQHVLQRHAAMVLDPHRTIPLAEAITRSVKNGDLVIDIGTGIGLLAFLACRAGAKQVYAVDVDGESLAVAEHFAKKFGLSDRITFVEGQSFDLELEAKANVIICETVGSIGFDENILATLFDAKKYLLKKGGVVIPERIELWGAPVESSCRLSQNEKRLAWSDIAGFDFSSPLPFSSATPVATRSPFADAFSLDAMLAKPKMLTAVDLQKPLKPQIHLTQSFSLEKKGGIKGMGIWMRVNWGEGCCTDASPASARTHWGQALLKIPTEQVVAGDQRTFELVIRPHADAPELQTEVLWRFMA